MSQVEIEIPTEMKDALVRYDQEARAAQLQIQVLAGQVEKLQALTDAAKYRLLAISQVAEPDRYDFALREGDLVLKRRQGPEVVPAAEGSPRNSAEEV